MAWRLKSVGLLELRLDELAFLALDPGVLPSLVAIEYAYWTF